ncbi:MAG: S8 family serine peptidase [Chloroflexota bacterium]|nr:S8 family serine peptidase [Chloroflexota bacterium]
MSKRTRMYVRMSMLVMLAAILVAAGIAPSIQASQVTQHAAPKSASDFAQVDAAVSEALHKANGPTPLMIELTGLPATVAYSQAGGGKNSASASAVQAGKQQSASNEQAQQAVLRSLSAVAPSAKVLYQVQKAYNGIAVIADSQAVAQMRNIPGIKAIHVLETHVLDNASSVTLIGAPVAWSAPNGFTGDNISIGIIDTGIDYLHTNFGGPGSGYNVYTDTTPRAVTAGAGVFPNAKVVGGFDFAGNSYNADPTDSTPPFVYQPNPVPDDNPLDCASTMGGGHGSHVAGSAAGYGVNANGSTYTGPYNSTSVPTTTMRIGPGVAPHADLYALRIFGCEGSTNLTTKAIDWAVDPNEDEDFSDHLDIINMSLGSSYGTPDDSSAAATNNAALVGVQVVTSAGNNSDVYYITGSPGSATWALATANSVDEVDITDGFRVNAPNVISGTKPGSFSSSYNWASPPITNPVPITANLYYPATNQYGCSAWTGSDLTNISGTIVLVDWRKTTDVTFPCGSAARANNATAAGAKGIIMVDRTTYLDTAIAGNANIPAIYTVKQVGDQLKSQLTAGTPSSVSVTLSNEYRNTVRLVSPGRADTLSPSSSRGPRTIDNALKPDIAAPGQGIFSTDAGTGNQGRSLNGTSMASPHMAGVMALLHQARPGWTVEEYKALAMNTAINDLYTEFFQSGIKYPPSRVGAGRVNVPAAISENVVAYNAETDGAVSVSFGSVEVLGTATLTKTIEVVNKGNAVEVFQVGYDARNTVPGVSYSFPDGNMLSVPAGGTVTFRVQLNANAAQMKNSRDATVATVQATTLGNLPRHWLTEAQGLITLTPSNRPTMTTPALRVPVYATLRPASDMTTVQESLVFDGPNSSTNLELTGQGVNTGSSFPTDTISLVSAFEVATTSAQIELSPPDITESARSADLQYVGVTSDAPALAAGQTLTQTVIFFGISSWGDWTHPANEIEFDIWIDRDRNGTEDAVLYNRRLSDAAGQNADVFVTHLLNGPSFGSGPIQDYTNWYPASTLPTAIFNNNVLVMPMFASSLYTNTSNTRFNYRVETYTKFFGIGDDPIDSTGWLTYDYANPGLDFTGGVKGLPMYNDLPGNSIPVTYDEAAFDANGSLGALLLHHYNVKGDRAQVLGVFTADEITATPQASSTPNASPSPTAIVCTIQFSDVPPGSTFYPFVRCLACQGVLGGYADGTFRPSNPVTRGQIAKIVSNAAGFNEEVEGQTYSDVPPSDDPSSFYPFVERLSTRNIIGGYPCGSDIDGDGDVDEECDDVSRAFFRPSSTATRGQMAKIVSNAAGFTDMVSGQTFADVPPSTDPSSFYIFVERLAQRGVIGGYPCGGPGEPCTAGNRPYYRPGAQVTRGQAAKIVSNTFFPNCQTALPAPSATATMQPVATTTQTIPGPTATPPPTSR